VESRRSIARRKTFFIRFKSIRSITLELTGGAHREPLGETMNDEKEAVAPSVSNELLGGA
jgi:hypothetical protein